MDINEAWKSTCRVLLGEEIGDMERYGNYLRRYVDAVNEKSSSLSGKKVAISSENICKGARFISHDEVEQYGKMAAKISLDVNDLKDIDSLVSVAQERAYYCGNIVLGNSGNVEKSNRCINTFYVHESQDIYDSKYVAYSCTVRYGDYIFGSNSIGETKFGIKNFETYRDVRCMETIRTYNSSDCYFTGNIGGCTHCMFSFNQRNKSNLIGNRQFSRDEYLKLKEKLLEDVRTTLQTKKSIPGIADIIRG
jgi:hypothetical protein